VLTRYVDGVPLRFCSNAARQADGTIWFTESTSRYDFENWTSAHERPLRTRIGSTCPEFTPFACACWRRAQ
jgi:hypothetical protein